MPVVVGVTFVDTGVRTSFSVEVTLSDGEGKGADGVGGPPGGIVGEIRLLTPPPPAEFFGRSPGSRKVFAVSDLEESLGSLVSPAESSPDMVIVEAPVIGVTVREPGRDVGSCCGILIFRGCLGLDRSLVFCLYNDDRPTPPIPAIAGDTE